MPVAIKAYVNWFGYEDHWAAHTEAKGNPAEGESSEHSTVAEAVAWARERTDWVLIATDPLQWAGAPEKQPPDVPRLWQG